MKLVHPDINFQIDLYDTNIVKLVIEAPRVFNSLTYDIFSQSEGGEGKFTLSEKGKILKISENIYGIINPFAIDYNTKKALTKLYGVLRERILTTESIIKLNQIYALNVQFLEEIFDSVMFPLDYAFNVDVNSFLKFMDVKFEVLECELIEKIIDYMLLMQELFGYSAVFLVNVGSYLDESEIDQLYKFAVYHKIAIVMIESSNNRLQRNGEKVYIIDKDCCEIIIEKIE